MIDHGALHLALRTHARNVVVAETAQTFSRASVATYTDLNGVVQTAAIDVPRTASYSNGVGPTLLTESTATNLVRHSSAFDNAAWNEVPGDGAVSIIAANAGTAPDGTMTADRVFDTSQSFTPGSTGIHTVSLFVKASAGTTDGTSIRVRLSGKTDLNAGSNTAIVNLNLEWSGGVPTPSIVGGAGTLLTTETLANGWYRVAAYAALGTHNFYTVRVDGVSGGDILAWGAQVESGSVATSYIASAASPASRAADVDGSYFSLAATATGYTRSTGSFVDDGFAVGMEVTPTGFTQTAVGTITALTATDMTISGGRTPEVVGACALSVGLPSRFGWANVALGGVNARQSPHPYGEEEYLPGGAPFKQTLGPLGRLIVRPTYVIRIAVAQNTDATALHAYTDALLTHFAPTTPLTVAGGTAWVRSDLAPFPSPIAQTEDGWAVVTLSVPLEYHTDNSR